MVEYIYTVPDRTLFAIWYTTEEHQKSLGLKELGERIGTTTNLLWHSIGYKDVKNIKSRIVKRGAFKGCRVTWISGVTPRGNIIINYNTFESLTFKEYLSL